MNYKIPFLQVSKIKNYKVIQGNTGVKFYLNLGDSKIDVKP